MILYIKHIGIEGPDTLGDFMSRRGFSSRTVELWAGDPLPRDLSGVDAVVALGGPMNVYEEERYPFLKQDQVFLRKVLDAGVPFLGICLGSQLLAKACGARVIRARKEEIGFFPVHLTDAGQRDPLFHGLPPVLDVFQWHGDTFEIPQGGECLAGGTVCPHQAFRVGARAYGFQFHIEVTSRSIREWSEAYFDGANPEFERQREAMLAHYERMKEKFHQTAERIYNNFSTLITECRRS